MGSFGHFYLRIAKIAAGRNFVSMKKSDLYRVASNCNVRGGVAMDSILNRLKLSLLARDRKGG